MHSALLVGLLRAKMMGLSLKAAMSLMIFSVKAPAMAATPWCGERSRTHQHKRFSLFSGIQTYTHVKFMFIHTSRITIS